MPELEPITREEKLLDGQDLEPITRREMFIKRIYDKTQTIPEPITREEYFLKKAGEGSGGDITIEQLTATANGTYQEEGKAYSPVVVNVPTPENSYQLKSIENTPTDIATFNASALPMPSLKIGIEPVQSGSGDPSPENIRPISGHTEANVVVEGGQNLYSDSIVWKNGYYISASGVETQSNNYKYTQTYIEVDPSTTYSIQADITAETDLAITVPYYTEAQSFISRDLVSTVAIGTHTYKVDFTTPSNCKYIRMSVPTDTSNIVIYKKYVHTIQFKDGDNPLTVYGGTLDVVSGELVVDRVMVTVDENSNIFSGSGGLPFRIDLLTGAKASSSTSALTGVKCNFLKEVTQSSSWGVDGTFSRVTTDAKIVYFKVNSEITTIQQLKTFLQSNNLQFVYELATPLTIQLTPTAISTQDGTNNIWADTGDVIEWSYFKSLN
jgi:hypothetical protein